MSLINAESAFILPALEVCEAMLLPSMWHKLKYKKDIYALCHVTEIRKRNWDNYATAS
jgi:hypothetical protein